MSEFTDAQEVLDVLQTKSKMEPVLIGRYMGFRNDSRMQLVKGTDRREERATVTFTVGQKNGLHLQTEHIIDYKNEYDPNFVPDLKEGRLYCWPIGAFDMKEGRSRAILSRKVPPFLLD